MPTNHHKFQTIEKEKISELIFPDKEVLKTIDDFSKRKSEIHRAMLLGNKYKGKVTKDKKAIEQVERLIEQCHNGAELVKRPLNVTFENLGKNVNSEFPDFYPIVSPDESTLYFTTRRKSPTAMQTEFDGLYPSDIFFTVMNKSGEENYIIDVITENYLKKFLL